MMENYDDLLTETAPAEQSDYDKASWKNRKKLNKRLAELDRLFSKSWVRFSLALLKNLKPLSI